MSGPDGGFMVPVPQEAYDGLINHAEGETPRIVATAPGFGFGWADPAAGKDLTVRLVSDDVSIEGRILDPDGRPVAGATVKTHNVWAAADENLGPFIAYVKAWGARPWQANPKLNLITLNLAATTGTDGKFRLDGIGKDRVAELVIAGPAIASEELSSAITRDQPKLRSVSWLRFESGQTSYHGCRGSSTQARRTRLVLGTKRDRDTGQPLPGIRIDGSVVEDHPGRFTVVRHHEHDPAGNFRLTGLPVARSYQLRVTPGPGIPYTPEKLTVSATMAAVDPAKTEITLKRGIPVRGRLFDKRKDGLGPVRGVVSYYPFADNPRAKDVTDGNLEATSGDDGRYEMIVYPGRGVITARAKDGDYLAGAGRDAIADLERVAPPADLYVSFPNTPRYHVIAEVNPSPETDALIRNLAFEHARTQTGSVVDPDGQPLNDVVAYGINREGIWIHKILESGTFTVSNLDPREPRRVTFFQTERKLAGSVRISGDGARATGYSASAVGRRDGEDCRHPRASTDRSDPCLASRAIIHRTRARPPGQRRSTSRVGSALRDLSRGSGTTRKSTCTKSTGSVRYSATSGSGQAKPGTWGMSASR